MDEANPHSSRRVMLKLSRCVLMMSLDVVVGLGLPTGLFVLTASVNKWRAEFGLLLMPILFVGLLAGLIAGAYSVTEVWCSSGKQWRVLLGLTSFCLFPSILLFFTTGLLLFFSNDANRAWRIAINVGSGLLLFAIAAGLAHMALRGTLEPAKVFREVA